MYSQGWVSRKIPALPLSSLKLTQNEKLLHGVFEAGWSSPPLPWSPGQMG